MKYHRGRYIEGQWIFGGICRETKACFLVPVERRDKDTLLLIIRAHILPGTRVMSDMWKAYDCLQDEGYVHLTENHSLNFVDPDTGAHTQGIENRWWCVKRGLPPYRNVQRTLRKLPTGVYVASALWRGSFWQHYQAHCRPLWGPQGPINVPRSTLCTVRDPTRYISREKARIKYDEFVVYKHWLHVKKESKNKRLKTQAR